MYLSLFVHNTPPNNYCIFATMNFTVATFNELTNIQLYKIMSLRQKIFVVEQNCIYEDLDDLDQGSMHVMGFDNDKLTCYARVLQGDAYNDSYMHIGRVVVDMDYRSRQLGHELMEYCISLSIQRYPLLDIKISAQKHLENFYNKQGFIAVGNMYLEDNIPHVAMIRLTK